MERLTPPAGVILFALAAGVIGWIRWAPSPFGLEPGDLTGTWRADDGSALELRGGRSPTVRSPRTTPAGAPAAS
ncbi:hypothetical protein ACFXGI_10500 [Streptomyces sp. NPDC059355]|uniref:hypothetical protein n=1 Tax=Streptomyces sp. NPDC059355 TaxID=3346811 RepID=UPI0036C4DD7A